MRNQVLPMDVKQLEISIFLKRVHMLIVNYLVFNIPFDSLLDYTVYVLIDVPFGEIVVFTERQQLLKSGRHIEIGLCFFLLAVLQNRKIEIIHLCLFSNQPILIVRIAILNDIISESRTKRSQIHSSAPLLLKFSRTRTRFGISDNNEAFF